MSRRQSTWIAAMSFVIMILLLPTSAGTAADSRPGATIPAAAAVPITGSLIDELYLTYNGSTLWSYMVNLELDQDYAYCCMRHGLLIVDITDQSAPIRRGQVYLGHTSSLDVAVGGNYAFLTDFSGLNVINISDADAPHLECTYETSGRAYAVEVVDTLAYVADQIDGLLIINIRDPQAPSLVATYDTPGISRGMYVRDTLIYVADWGSGVQIVNVADPQNPQLLGGCDTIGYSGDLVIQDSFAYVAARFSGFQIVSVADPLAPYLVGGLNPANYVNYVAVTDTVAIVTCGDWPFPDSSVQILNVADPENPQVIEAYAESGDASGLVLDGTTAYIADRRTGLHVVDVGEPDTPNLVGMYETPLPTSDVVHIGDYAYVSSATYDSWKASLHVVNVADPTDPYVEGSCDTLGYGYRLAVTDTMAYLVGFGSGEGLNVVNVANPQLPHLVATLSVPGYNSNVTVSGEHAYLAGDRGMLVLDVSSPDTPVPTDSFTTGSVIYGTAVSVVDDLAYLVGNQLYVINIADPGSLYLEGSLGISGSKTDIVVSGSYAYVTTMDSELMIGALVVIDIDTAEAPTWVTQFDLPVEAIGVQVYGDYAFVSTYSELVVINISDPQNLYRAGGYAGGCSETAVDSGIVYVVDWYSLLILQAASPTCGDADASGAVDIDDAIQLIAYIFSGGPAPAPLEVGDTDCSGDLDIDDAVYVVNYIFSGGHAPCDIDGDGVPDC